MKCAAPVERSHGCIEQKKTVKIEEQTNKFKNTKNEMSCRRHLQIRWKINGRKEMHLGAQRWFFMPLVGGPHQNDPTTIT